MNESSWVHGHVVGFDLETTSADPHTARPVSYALVAFEHGEIVRSDVELINPGMPIPAEATAIHGITDAMVVDAISLESATAHMAGFIAGVSDAGKPLAGMNLGYDLTVLKWCVYRDTQLGPFSFVEPRRVIDLLVIDKHVDQYRRGSRKLVALAQHYGVPLGDDAHDAEADVVATVNTLFALAEQHHSIRDMDSRTLHEMQKRWHREQLGSLSSYFVKQGKDPVPSWQFEWPVFGVPVDA